MAFTLNAEQYCEYIRMVAEKIRQGQDYITGLDAATGDGDHWANINMGFQSLVEAGPQIAQMPMDGALRQIGMLMMSKVGGSSGILYGGAYIAASTELKGKQEIDSKDLCRMLEVMAEDMMKRGDAKPGYKTMIDALSPAAVAYREHLEKEEDDRDILQAAKKAAEEGAEATRNMEAVKGRASYQTDKGVGHLDPGAVTMSWQIACLCDYICDNIL